MNSDVDQLLTGATMLNPVEGGTPRKPPAKKTEPKPNRFVEVNGFVDVSMRELTRAEICVWLILWRDTKGNGSAKISQEQLAQRAGMSARSVRTAIARLTKLDLVKVVWKGHVGKASTYCVRGVKS